MFAVTVARMACRHNAFSVQECQADLCNKLTDSMAELRAAMEAMVALSKSPKLDGQMLKMFVDSKATPAVAAFKNWQSKGSSIIKAVERARGSD